MAVLLAPGTTLGRYRIVDALRAGGMATLYLARRTGAAGFSKPVAIKVVHEHLSGDERFLEMFVAEAKLAARVDDPHVAHTEELGHENDMYFIAMEYVLGGSLAQIIPELRKRARAFSPSLATRVAADAARGLHAVHEATSERGEPLLIVHRDVSPQNILVSTKGIVKLIDLGVARAKDVRRTEEGSLTGKLAYMSPEQARGEAIDRRTDVYALGIVLWEMLTSQRLFRAANDYELLKKVQAPVIEPPSRWSASEIGPALDAAVMRALAPDPKDRPPTAEAFCEELLAADPEARRVTTSELGGIVERTLKEKLAAERELLRGGGDDGAERVLSEPIIDDDAIRTRTVPLLEGHATVTTLVSAKRPRWPLVAAAAIVALGIGIAIVFAPRPEAPAPAATTTTVAATTEAPAATTEAPAAPSPEIVEVFETPAPPPAPSAAVAAPVTRPKRRPHAATPSGSTSIVHGTPLTTDVR